MKTGLRLMTSDDYGAFDAWNLSLHQAFFWKNAEIFNKHNEGVTANARDGLIMPRVKADEFFWREEVCDFWDKLSQRTHKTHKNPVFT